MPKQLAAWCLLQQPLLSLNLWKHLGNPAIDWGLHANPRMILYCISESLAILSYFKHCSLSLFSNFSCLVSCFSIWILRYSMACLISFNYPVICLNIFFISPFPSLMCQPEPEGFAIQIDRLLPVDTGPWVSFKTRKIAVGAQTLIIVLFEGSLGVLVKLKTNPPKAYGTHNGIPSKNQTKCQSWIHWALWGAGQGGQVHLPLSNVCWKSPKRWGYNSTRSRALHSGTSTKPWSQQPLEIPSKSIAPEPSPLKIIPPLQEDSNNCSVNWNMFKTESVWVREHQAQGKVIYPSCLMWWLISHSWNSCSKPWHLLISLPLPRSVVKGWTPYI